MPTLRGLYEQEPPRSYPGSVNSPFRRCAPALAVTALALALGLAGCATGAPAPAVTVAGELSAAPCAGAEGVTLIVDASALGEASEQWCVPAAGTTAASDILAAANVQTEGTTDFGDQVLCRVNGLPAGDTPLGSTTDPSYIEACHSMPAAFAYWSMWVRPAGGDWGYAQEGLSTLKLNPGESLELLFTLDGAPTTP